jgi:hypothetical protein
MRGAGLGDFFKDLVLVRKGYWKLMGEIRIKNRVEFAKLDS